MGTSNDDVMKSVQYYQERLDRYALNKNEEKMLYVIKKLNKLPINTALLQSTGVGRTVNALKKHEGKVGESAKELVASWKDMVLREEKAAQETARDEPKEEDVDSVYSSDHEADNLSTEENDSHRGNHLESSPRNDQSNDSDEEHINSKSKTDDYYYKNEVCSETEPEVEQYSVKSPEEEYKSKKRHHSTDRAEDEKHAKHKSKKAKRDHHRYEDKYKSEHKARTARKEYELESSNQIVNHKSDKMENHESKRKSHDSKTRDDSSRSKSEKRKDDSEEGRSQQRSDKKKTSESKSHSTSEKHVKQSRREKDNSERKEDTSKKTEKKHKSHHHERDSLTKKASDEPFSDSKSRPSREKTKKDKNHKKDRETKFVNKDKETKSVNKDKIVNGIDSESGASFAEALGMCGPKTIIPSVKKKHASSSISDKPRSSSSLELDNSAGSSTYTTNKNRTSSGNSRSEPVQQDTVPELLREKELEPLNINLSSLLPEITPNYRPLGVSLDLQPKRSMTDDEALSRVMANRNQRTKVYSGNKSYGKVESLFQICVKILQDNIDALEYTGGVPYSILKPILERATPDQLFNMEHHNPYLIEDTDELWLLHCQKEFRTRKRDELESWREMYMRCLDEREARLNAITANIKQSQDKSIPIRTTKLAYVDSVVKPPRNIARQQVKNGIFDKKPISTTAKLSAIAKSGEAGKISVPNPGSRAGERSTATVKPKKAPLMAKTLSYLKNRFKR